VSVRAEALMGTTVTIETVGAGHDTAVERALEWFRVVEETCTRFNPHSELCQLTLRPGTPTPVSRLLFEAIRFALSIAAASEGAFDPTIGAWLQQRGFDREHRSGTAIAPIVEPSADVSFRDVTIDESAQTVTLHRPLLLDLGAVAKGLAVDLAARELAASRDFAIDAGGDLYLGGTNLEGQPWSIGIRHPRQPGACIAAVRVSDCAVCTSGDYERQAPQPWRGPCEVREDEPDRAGPTTEPALRESSAEHHIIDPRTGLSPQDVASVTVIAPFAMLADALATTAFVMGRDDGLPWLEQMGVEALIVTRTLESITTPGWPGA
jgi:thiamine biosynthesis lipoprotein